MFFQGSETTFSDAAFRDRESVSCGSDVHARIRGADWKSLSLARDGLPIDLEVLGSSELVLFEEE